MQQHPHYAAALHLLGLDVLRLTVLDPQPAAHLQVVQRNIGPLRVCWVPRGPVWAGARTQEAQSVVLRALRSALPRSHLQLVAPDRAADGHLLHNIGYRRLSAPQTHAWLDLTADAQTRLSRQHGKWRNRLRHAQSAGLRVEARPFCPQADTALLQLEQTQRRAKRYRALPPGFTLAWGTASPGQAQVFEAHTRDGLAAFILVLTHAPTASYHIGWTSDTGRARSAHNLLLWEASTWLAARGYTALDLGLIDPAHSPGLTRFKLGTGAQAQAGGATFFALPRLCLPQIRHRAA